MAQPLNDAESIVVGIAHLRSLDLAGLRACWRSGMGRVAPSHLPKHLLFRILAYRLQAERIGDLDKETLRLLDSAVNKKASNGKGACFGSHPIKRRSPRPGTILVREWQGVPQRVMVLADGFGWNDKSYRSLSQVAFAITGTRWNGPRFFGLREKSEASEAGRRT